MTLTLTAPNTPAYSYDGVELLVRITVDYMAHVVLDAVTNNYIKVNTYDCDLLHAMTVLERDFGTVGNKGRVEVWGLRVVGEVAVSEKAKEILEG